MGALDRIFRRRQEQQRPLESYVRGLWRAGEQGVWYDPSDLTTLFQDVGGSTPVTAVGQPVGLMLDKRYGLVRGAEQAPADISAGWSIADARWTYAAGSVSWAGGGGTSLTTSRLLLPVSFAGKFVELSYTVTGFSGTNNGGPDSGVLSSGPSGTGTLIDTRFAANGTFRFMGYWRGGGSADGRTISILGRGTNSFTISNLSVREVPGNHASQGTATSRPTLQDDTGSRYLAFDGVDDWLQTASVDFSGTATATLWAAIRKLSDGAVGMVVELSAGAIAGVTNGSFHLAAPNPATGNLSFKLVGGSTPADAVVAASGYAAPVSVLATYQMDIGGAAIGDEMKIRVNGVAPAVTYPNGVTPAGGGNLGNHAIYIGRRAGTSMPFNGRLYGLVVRGAATPGATLVKVERYLNAKARAY